MPAEPCGAAETAPPSKTPPRVVRALRERMPRQVRREVRLRRDRPDARSAAAVRDRERLVEVQVRDVAAEVAEAGVAEQRVEVRAVDVHLAARIVHGLRDLEHVVLVHPVRRRVRDHERGQLVGVRGDLRAQVVEVDVAGLVARDDDDLHAGEHRGCRVGAVRGRRDEAHRAVGVAVRRGGSRGSPAGRRAHPASRRSAAATPRRSRSPRRATPRAARSSPGSRARRPRARTGARARTPATTPPPSRSPR